MTRRVAVVGLNGGTWFGRAAELAMRAADVVIGSERQRADLAPLALTGDVVALPSRVHEVVALCASHASDGRLVCVLASGDPGFFGIVRALAECLGVEALDVHPAPSSVSLAFARIGVPWDDAVVTTCHGRPVADAADAVLRNGKVAVFVSPEAPPEALGRAAVQAGVGTRDVWVCERLGSPEERVVRTDLEGLAAGAFDPLSVVVLIAPGAAVAAVAATGWGRDESQFAHRHGLITKAEVRAVALGKLELPAGGVFWDVGAGSGSVAVEAARLVPGLRIIAVERDAAACEQIRVNALGTGVTVVEGDAPAALAELPDPDRAFIGGGGTVVLDAVLDRLRPGGTVVATFAVLASAVAAAERLGHLVQLQVSRGMPIGPEQQLRLQAENPVFVVWGTR